MWTEHLLGLAAGCMGSKGLSFNMKQKLYTWASDLASLRTGWTFSMVGWTVMGHKGTLDFAS